MDIDATKELVRCYIHEVVNAASYDAISTFVADDIIDHNAGADQAAGLIGYIQHLRGGGTTFPDFQLTIEAQIGEGDLVVTRVTGRGTHQGAWLGIRPLGTPIVVTVS